VGQRQGGRGKSCYTLEDLSFKVPEGEEKPPQKWVLSLYVVETKDDGESPTAGRCVLVGMAAVVVSAGQYPGFVGYP